MENKRIGFDAKRALHNFRGLGNYSRSVIEGLLKHYPSNEYFLFSPTPKDSRALEWLEAYPELKLVTPTGAWRGAQSLWRSVWLGRIANSYKLDLFHGLSHELPPFGLNCAKLVTIHDLIYLRYPEYFPVVDRVVYNRKFRSACKSADKIVAICDQTKRDIINFFHTEASKIEVAYQSVGEQFYETLSLEAVSSTLSRYQIEKPYFFYVGALEARKNAHMLVRSFGAIANEVSADLVIVGKGGKYEEECKQIVTDLGLNERVHFLGGASYEDLPALYQGALALCFPSHFEGFGIPIVEALFSQTPVITSKGSCFPESAGPDSLFVDSESMDELAFEMKRVASDEELRAKMASRGHEYAQRFHDSQTTKRLAQIYMQVMK